MVMTEEAEVFAEALAGVVRVKVPDEKGMQAAAVARKMFDMLYAKGLMPKAWCVFDPRYWKPGDTFVTDDGTLLVGKYAGEWIGIWRPKQ